MRRHRMPWPWAVAAGLGETGQAGRRWSREIGRVNGQSSMLQEKYEALFGVDIDTHLYVGNLHQHRTSFSALAPWTPKAEPPDPYEGHLPDYA